MTGDQGLPTAPQCPAWCQVHDESATGWDVHPAAVTRLCRRTVEVGIGVDVLATIELQRFAQVIDDAVLVAEPTLELTHEGPLTPSAALLVAATLTRAADLLREPRGVVAA